MEDCYPVRATIMEPSVSNKDDLVMMTEVKLSILRLFSKHSPSNKSAKKGEITTCGICLKPFPMDTWDDKQISCKLNEDVVGVVLQSLLVPQNIQKAKISDITSLLVCNQCDREITTLVDIFLQLEDLRKEFESIRLKIAKQIITKSIRKSEEHFKCWGRELESVGWIYPSLVQLNDFRLSDVDNRNNDNCSNLPLENTLNLEEDTYSAIKAKYKRIHSTDKRLTEMSCVVVMERIPDSITKQQIDKPESERCIPSTCEDLKLADNLDNNDIETETPTSLIDESSSLVDLNSSINPVVSATDVFRNELEWNEELSQEMEVGEDVVAASVVDTWETSPCEIMTEEKPTFDIIMDQNAMFITTDHKLTKMSAVVALEKLDESIISGKRKLEISNDAVAYIDDPEIKVEMGIGDELPMGNSSETNLPESEEIVYFTIRDSVANENQKETGENSRETEGRVLRKRKASVMKNNASCNIDEEIDYSSHSELIGNETEDDDDDENFNVSDSISEEDSTTDGEDSDEGSDHKVKRGKKLHNEIRSRRIKKRIRVRKHRKQSLSCSICQKIFRYAYDLKVHLQNIHKLSQLEAIEKLNEVREPLKKFIGPKFECQCWMCPKLYSRRDRLSAHIIEAHKVRGCLDCSETFKTDVELRNHRRLCIKQSSKTRVLTEHTKVVNSGASFIGPKFPHKCSSCSNSYWTAGFLAKHLELVHDGIISHKKSAICKWCSMVFETEEELKVHNSLVHRDKDSQRKNILHSLGKAVENLNEDDSLHSKEDAFSTRNECESTSSLYLMKIGQSQNSDTEIVKEKGSTSQSTTHNNDSNEDGSCGVNGHEDYALSHNERVEVGGNDKNLSDSNSEIPRDKNGFHQLGKTNQNQIFVLFKKVYVCKECSLAFTSMELLGSHFESQHSLERQPGVPVHDKKNVTIRGINRRTRQPKRSNGKKIRYKSKLRIPCNLCGKIFNERFKLQRHIYTVHKRKNDQSENEDAPVVTSAVNTKASTKAVFIGPKLQFQCSKCSASYRLSSSLRVHLAMEHEVLGSVCLTCHMTFKTLKELNAHKKSAHVKKARITARWRKENPNCKICGCKFHGPQSMRVHMYQQHRIFIEKPNINCTHCDLVFNDKRVFATHRLRYHFIGSANEAHNFRCELCLAYFSQRKAVRKHHVQKHSSSSENSPIKKYKCFLCRDATEYLNAEGLLEHERSEEHQSELKKKISVYCNVCRKNFNGNVKALQDHLAGDEHKKELGSLGEFEIDKFCVPCRQNFNSFQELKEHEDIGAHHKQICHEFRSNRGQEIPFECPVICHACPKTFDNHSLLDRHVLTCHPPSGHTCKVCNETFRSSMELILHKRTHRGQRNHVCEKCGKTFTGIFNLQQHNRFAHGSESKCDDCGEIFGSKMKLKMHILKKHNRHNSVKNLRVLECTYCEQTYPQTGTFQLRRHLCKSHSKDHLKDRKFVCSVCFHIFASQEELDGHQEELHAHLKCFFCCKYFQMTMHLESHMRNHTGERPFECSLCRQFFKTKGHLVQHENGVHKNINRVNK